MTRSPEHALANKFTTNGSEFDTERKGFLFYTLDNSSIHKDKITWIERDELLNCQEINDTCEDIEWNVDALADKLHQLASDLPEIGSLNHVVWFGASSWPVIEEGGLELYGALKRLKTWHNAHITMVHNSPDDHELNPDGAKWARVLNCSVIRQENLEQCPEASIWHGGVELHTTEIGQPFILPNFALKRSKCTLPKHHWIFDRPPEEFDLNKMLLDSTMQFITSTNIRDIPSFYVTGSTYELEVTGFNPLGSKSHKFLAPLMDNPQLVYIVRLHYGTTLVKRKDTKSGKREERAAKTWADSLMENINSVQEPTHSTELGGSKGSYHFMLCAGQDAQGGNVIKAHLMRSPYEINGNLAFVLADLENKIKYERAAGKENVEEVTKRMEDCIESLPHYKADTFLHLETEIQGAQDKILQQWKESCEMIEGGAVITGGDLLYLLSTTRQRYMARYREQHGGQPTVPYPKQQRKRIRLPEKTVIDSEHLIERRMLEHDSKLREKLQRNTSNESLGGLSPPTHAHVIKLQASELLKYFNSDGTPKDTDLEPIQIKRSRLRKYDSGELCTSEWPHCSHYKYHDVYYNVGVSPEKFMHKCHRLSERMRTTETLSTCTEQQRAHAKTMHVHTGRTSGSISGSGSREDTKRRSTGRGNITPTRLRHGAHARKLSMRKTPSSTERRRKRSLSNTQITPQADSEKPQRKRLRQSETITPVASQPRKEKLARTEPVRRTQAKHEAVKDKESRSARHKKKLEEIVRQTLLEHGADENDKTLYQRCFTKLYQLTFTEVKTLKTSAGLRQEMQKIARTHAEMVVVFETAKLKQASR